MKFDLAALPGILGKGLQRIFGSANTRALNSYRPIVQATNEAEQALKDLDHDGVLARMADMREQIKAGDKTLEDILPDVFALTRLASMRTLGLRPFDVQVLGAAVLHQGNIAEMVTGEGKTLVATLPAALNALTGEGVYVVTVNDYLAKRDRDWMAPIFEYLGLTVGAIQSDMDPTQRQREYGCDITYGTNNEFGFDYLRDNMKWRSEQQVQKSLNYAIVDEVDSILVDEARTPLIISGPPEGKAEKFIRADRVARQLQEDTHFEVKLKDHSCILNEEGIEKAEKLVGVDSFYTDPKYMDWPHLLECALRAHHIYERDKNYVVVQDEKTGERDVVIVDEFTGRLMPGRRWSDGLHQSVEAKEGLPPKEENQVLATITLQNYFRMFDKLAGMTGTAMTEAAEFSKIYDLDVIAIPTNQPMIRKDEQDQIYLDEESKLDAISDEISKEHARGRPILVGTTSIAKSEKLSELLKVRDVPHHVLNAKRHRHEAEIVAHAGRAGRVTVATNMAGRGTDIVLGGSPEVLWREDMAKTGVEESSESAQSSLKELEKVCQAERERILELGGLYVIGTERHEARRIDNQLRGRCGRQGDPGETRFFLSFDDDLMRIFARDWVRTMMERMGLKPGEVIESPMVSRGIARAQKKVEARNFDVRKHLIEYDEVMDKQRKFIYGQRQEVLERVDLGDKVLGMFETVLDPILDEHAGNKDEPVDYAAIQAWLVRKCGPEIEIDGLDQVERGDLFKWVMERVEAIYGKRHKHYGDDAWEQLQFFLLLDTIDNKWKDHLHAMEVLKAGIHLRSYAQVDPKNEYKKEGYEKFQLLKQAVADHLSDLIFKAEIQEQELEPPRPAMALPPPDPVTAQAMLQAMRDAGNLPPEIMEAVARGAEGPSTTGVAQQPKARQQVARAAVRPVGTAPSRGKKPGRNDPCPCGSGVKYKKCCHPAFG